MCLLSHNGFLHRFGNLQFKVLSKLSNSILFSFMKKVFFVKSEQCHIDGKTLFGCSQVDVGESIVFSALLLCFTWGELNLLLEEFVPNNERSQCHDPNLYRNLEAIFTISSKTWKKLHTLATSRAQKKSCYLWVKNFRFCEIFMMIFMWISIYIWIP